LEDSKIGIRNSKFVSDASRPSRRGFRVSIFESRTRAISDQQSAIGNQSRPKPRQYTVLLLVSLLVAVSGSSARSNPQDEFTRTFDKTVTLESGQGVQIEHRFGNITIHTQSGREVHIVAHIYCSGSDRDQASRVVNEINIRVKQTGGGVSIRTEYPEWLNHVHIICGSFSYAVDYEITMPEAASLGVRNQFGNVAVTGLKGDADLHNSNGSLTFRDGRGTQQLENSFGGIEVAGNVGDVHAVNSNGYLHVADIGGGLNLRDRFGEVKADRISKQAWIANGNGDVELSEAGGRSSIETSFGSVTATDVRGDLTVRNSNGSVEARDVEGAAEIRGSFGGIKLSLIRQGARVVSQNSDVTLTDVGGEAYVKTSFGLVRATKIGGPLTVENSNGGVNASQVRGAVSVKATFASVVLDGVGDPVDVDNQNGAIEVLSFNPRGSKGSTSTPCGDVTLRTSFSPIRLYLPASGGYRVEASTSFGHIKTELPITASGELSGDSLNGMIGNGACEVRLNDSNGNIEILRK
jgi:DUF4097 and DUF4098 domain-containing protein YvlB